MIKVNVDSSRLLNRFSRIRKNLQTLPWLKVGGVVRDSVHQNFDSQGRPVKWRKRKDNKPHPILNKTGKLKNSIYVEKIKDGVAIGTRVKYQAVHNFGYPQRNIPQRKYLMVQPEDRLKIDNIITNHIKKK